MFIKGLLLGITIGSLATLILYSSLILAKQVDERTYRS